MSESLRQLFVFWQFGGDNKSWCNQQCGLYYKGEMYCYGMKDKAMRSFWNGKPELWEQAFMRLDSEHGNAGIYFVMSYGESLGLDGFYECVDVIGRHPSWTLAVVTNNSITPTRLVNTKLAKDGRLFVHPCWHPYGMPNRVVGWEIFKKNLLIYRAAGVPVHVLYLWWEPQIKLFPQYFDWLDAHNFRVNVRRFVGSVGGVVLPVLGRVGAKKYPRDYTEAERGFLYANTCPKVTKYGLDLVKPTGRLCSAGKDMILVKCNGDVAYCADLEQTCIGNVFDSNFKLPVELVRCSAGVCGGDYGMLHLIDYEFGPNIGRLPNQPFLSIAEDLPDGSPVPYPKRVEMLKWLNKIRRNK